MMCPQSRRRWSRMLGMIVPSIGLITPVSCYPELYVDADATKEEHNLVAVRKLLGLAHPSLGNAIKRARPLDDKFYDENKIAPKLCYAQCARRGTGSEASSPR